jgi:hypothetical protein
MPLTSQLFQGDAALEAAANIDSAHITPGASGPHVAKIQKALNILDEAGLKADGVYGPATANAVLNYKTARDIVNRSYETKADDIVGRMTMAALDKEMAANEDSGSSVPIVSFSQHFSCEDDSHAAKKKSSGKSDLQPADPFLAALAVSMVSNLLIVIRETRFLLTAAGPFIQPHQKLKEPQGFIETAARRCIRLLINIFSLDQLENPRAGYDNIVRVFFNMDVALNRSFKTDPQLAATLFVPNTHISMEHKNAYTAAGGAFNTSKDKLAGIKEPADRIYICSHFTAYSELIKHGILIHEMAHFVSGQPLLIDHNHGVPKKGHMLTDRAPFDKIKPAAKLHSPEHYAFFALAAGLKAAGLDKVD